MTDDLDQTYTLDQVAALIPNRSGTGHVHRKTILRRVARGELPKPDMQFSDGSRIWRRSTLAAAGVVAQA